MTAPPKSSLQCFREIFILFSLEFHAIPRKQVRDDPNNNNANQKLPAGPGENTLNTRTAKQRQIRELKKYEWLRPPKTESAVQTSWGSSACTCVCACVCDGLTGRGGVQFQSCPHHLALAKWTVLPPQSLSLYLAHSLGDLILIHPERLGISIFQSYSLGCFAF